MNRIHSSKMARASQKERFRGYGPPRGTSVSLQSNHLVVWYLCHLLQVVS